MIVQLAVHAMIHVVTTIISTPIPIPIITFIPCVRISAAIIKYTSTVHITAIAGATTVIGVVTPAGNQDVFCKEENDDSDDDEESPSHSVTVTITTRTNFVLLRLLSPKTFNILLPYSKGTKAVKPVQHHQIDGTNVACFMTFLLLLQLF